MIELIMNSKEAIQALHECIWKVVSQVMEDAGKSVADGLGIALRLVDMLPTIPLQLAFNTATAGLLGCAPEVYAARPKTRTDGLDFSHAHPHRVATEMQWLYSSKEILKSAHGTEEKAIQPTWLLTVASVGSVGVKAVENEGVDDSNSVCMHLFLQLDVPHIPPRRACLIVQIGVPLAHQCHLVHHILPHTPHL